jgi:hypothetical protein
MRKPLGKLGGAISGPLLRAATLLLLFSPTFCLAQGCPYQPTVSNVNPATWQAGQTTNVTITGTNLDTAAAWVTEPNDAWTITQGDPLVQTATELQIPFTVPASDPTETITLVVDFVDGGCANEVLTQIQIEHKCNGPTISTVAPLGWWAGQDNQDITISGSCFQTSSDPSGPSKVTATANGVTLSNVNAVSATEITATVKVTKKAPAETVTLTVTNPSSSGAPQSVTANPAPVVLPIPIIKWKGNEISGDNAKEESVKVGQPVELTTTPATLPGGFTVSKSTWNVPGDDIKSYNGSSSGITVDDDVDLKSANTTFYWLYPDTGLNVTYEYCATDPSGNQICTSPQAKATFEAKKPNIDLRVTNPYNRGRVNELPVCGQRQPMAHLFYGDLHYLSGCSGDLTGPEGIDLTASGGDGGIYTFVQVIPTDTLSWDGQRPFQCGPYVNVLDGTFPFQGVRPNKIAPTMAYDGPGQGLPNIYSSGTRNFHAIMYLLWQPPQLSGTGTLSYPVPIGHQEWQFGATADQKAPIGRGKWQQPVTNAAGAVGGFIPSQDSDNAIYGYPVWGSVSTIGSCDPVNQTQEIEE